jgi:hypothetical protein
VLIALMARHVVADSLLPAVRPSGRKRVDGEPQQVQAVPAWRLWTGVALATLVVWMVIGG